MNTFDVKKHDSNGLYYVIGNNVPDSFVAVDAADYNSVMGLLHAMSEDHERALDLLGILLKKEN